MGKSFEINMHERKTFITKGEVQYQVFFICLSHILMRMSLQDRYQERELVLVVIKVGLILLRIKL